MTDATTSNAPAQRLPWLLIVGLASLSLLWPLTALLGFGTGAPRALVIIGVIAAVWIGVVGFGRVHNPVLVLTLAGLGHGIIGFVIAVSLGTPGGAVWPLLIGLVSSTAWGALSGLIALAVQHARKRA